MRLVAFGCSNTKGQGLSDVWNKETKEHIINKPSKYAWPQILANKLNIECVNNGVAGASNKEIWYKILKFKFNKNDIVIVNWSYFDRWCIIDIDGKDVITQFLWGTLIKTKPSQYKTVSKNFFKYIHNHNDIVLDFYVRANHIQTVLQDKVKLIKHYRTNRPEFVVGPKSSTQKDVDIRWDKIKFSLYMDDRIHKQNFVDVQKFSAQEDTDLHWNKIKFSLYMDDYWKQTPMALDNAHPGTETHKAFATAIYDEINDEIT